ncbi:uncharacterized protein VNE69_06185 [Vairimorpha necatrix]|uniref:Uncharacterized protein n=1 Tax=Vairimorpha necatrix TaxID=6039 RepID=A0AAX4JD09_9MICR
MLQYIFLVICSVITSNTDVLNFFPKTIYVPNNTRKRRLDAHAEDFYTRLDHIEKEDDHCSASSSSSIEKKLYIHYINNQQKVMVLDLNSLQNVLDYKFLKEKLINQIFVWNKDDNSKELEEFIISDIDKNIINDMKGAKYNIQRKFEELQNSLNKHLNVIRTVMENIAPDEYINDMKKQLIFFEMIFFYLKKCSSAKQYFYKKDSFKILYHYNTLPYRLNIIKDEYQVLDRFEAFKMFFEHQYFISFESNEKKLLENAFCDIYINLKQLFDNIKFLQGYCSIIINRLQNLIFKEMFIRY